jgi:hypothetical protein
MTPNANTDRILVEMFSRLLNMRVSPSTVKKLTHVVDGVLKKVEGSLDLETPQGQNTFRALVCSMVVHGWGLGMHPDNNPAEDLSGKELEIKVCKDILVPMSSVQSLRYVQRDKFGRVKKALFEPDQNARIRGHIDSILGEIAATSNFDAANDSSSESSNQPDDANGSG